MVPAWRDVLAVAALGLAIALNGAENVWVQVALSVLVATSLVGLVLAKSPAGGGSAGLGWAFWYGGLGFAGLLYLVPIPERILGVIAPLTSEAFPGRAHAVSIDPGATLDGVWTCLLASAVVLAAARSGRARIRLERGVAFASGLVVTVALVHLAFQPAALYGFWPVQSTEAPWAPLVNRNFDAWLLVGFQPILWGSVLARRSWSSAWTWANLTAAVLSLGMIATTGASAPWFALVAAAVAVPLTSLFPKVPRVIWGAGAVAGAVAGVLWVPQTWLDDSMSSRSDLWWRTLSMFQQQPLGVGPGAFGHAIRPLQEPTRFIEVAHAHSDLFQVVGEYGVFGIGMLVAAGWLWAQAPQKGLDHRSTWLDLGLIAWTVHASLDFPLQMPGLAMVYAAAFSWRATAWQSQTDRTKVTPRQLAWAAAPALILATLAASLWRLQPEDPALDEATELARTGRLDEAAHIVGGLAASASDDPDRLLQIAAVQARAGQVEAAKVTLDRAMARHAADFRSRALASRVAEASGNQALAAELWAEALRRWPYHHAITAKPFDRALKLQPQGLWWVHRLEAVSQPVTMALLGQHLLQSGDPAGAYLAYESAARQRNYACLAARGEAMFRVGLEREGLDFLARCAESDPSDLSALETRARLSAERANWSVVLQDTTRALQRRPDATAMRVLWVQALTEVEGPRSTVEEAEKLGKPGFIPKPIAMAVAEAARRGNLWTDCLRWARPYAGAETPEITSLIQDCEARCSSCTLSSP